MTSFILRRFLALFPLLLGVTALAFLLMSLAPGDFLTPIKAQRDVDPQYILRLEEDFGLKRPWYVQYFYWLRNVVRGDFGYSWTYKVPVIALLWQRAPATLLLNVSSLLLAWGVAIPLGVLSAMYKDSWLDRLTSFLSYLSLSIPEFFLALLAIFFAARTGWFPLGGLTSLDYELLPPVSRLLDIAWHLVLPTLALGLGGIAGVLRIMRATVLDVVRAEYVTTARAKGLPEHIIFFRHVLRNAINPLLSSVGYVFSSLLSGSLLVENVLNYPGLGQLIYSAFLR
jgi:peptide/nickel transport system permease protein